MTHETVTVSDRTTRTSSENLCNGIKQLVISSTHFLIFIVENFHLFKKIYQTRCEIRQKIGQIIVYDWDKMDYLEYPKLEQELLILIKNYQKMPVNLKSLKPLLVQLPKSVQFNLYFEFNCDEELNPNSRI